jgi:hypothetical protein
VRREFGDEILAGKADRARVSRVLLLSLAKSDDGTSSPRPMRASTESSQLAGDSLNVNVSRDAFAPNTFTT